MASATHSITATGASSKAPPTVLIVDDTPQNQGIAEAIHDFNYAAALDWLRSAAHEQGIEL